MEKGLLVVCSSVHCVLKHEEVLGVLPAEAHGGDHPRCCGASVSYRNQVKTWVPLSVWDCLRTVERHTFSLYCGAQRPFIQVICSKVGMLCSVN